MANKYLDLEGVGTLWSAIKTADDAVKTALEQTIATKGSSIAYDESTKMIYLKDAKGNTLGNGINAAPFIKDGMLDDVEIVAAGSEGVGSIDYNGVTYDDGEKFIKFNWNTDAGTTKVDYLKVDEIGKTYVGSDSIDIGSDNTLTVKDVDAAKTTLKTDIQIAGGPLANNVVETGEEWPWKDEAGNKIIPSGKSMEEILTGLFLKVVNGTVTWGTKTWNPALAAPTATLSGAATVEVGTTLTATVATNDTVSGNTRSATCTASQGYFDTVDGVWVAGNKTISKAGSKSGNATITWTWNGVATTNTSVVVTKEGENKLVVSQSGITTSVDALPETTVYASTNTKAVLKDVAATITDTKPTDKALTSSNSDTVTGAYYSFIGYTDAVPTDSAGVRALNNGTKLGKGSIGTANTVYTINKNYMVVALPSGWNFTIQNSLGQDAQRDSFELSGTVNVVLPDNTTKEYNVYSIGWKDGQYKNLVIK